jgi:hypothetical protein
MPRVRTLFAAPLLALPLSGCGLYRLAADGELGGLVEVLVAPSLSLPPYYTDESGKMRRVPIGCVREAVLDENGHRLYDKLRPMRPDEYPSPDRYAGPPRPINRPSMPSDPLSRRVSN